MLLRYDVTRHNGDRVFGTSLYSEFAQEKNRPDFPGTDIECDLDLVEVVTTSDDYFSPKIYWRKDVFGADGSISPMLESYEGIPLDLAIIHLRDSWGPWILRSEILTDTHLATDCRLGVTAYNAKNKPMVAGIGQITEVDFIPATNDLPPKSGHIFTYTFSELFSGRWASPLLCGTVSGADRKQSPALYPDYSAPDGGTRPPDGRPHPVP